MHEKQLLGVMISLPESRVLTAVSPVLYGAEEMRVGEKTFPLKHMWHRSQWQPYYCTGVCSDHFQSLPLSLSPSLKRTNACKQVCGLQPPAAAPAWGINLLMVVCKYSGAKCTYSQASVLSWRPVKHTHIHAEWLRQDTTHCAGQNQLNVTQLCVMV